MNQRQPRGNFPKFAQKVVKIRGSKIVLPADTSDRVIKAVQRKSTELVLQRKKLVEEKIRVLGQEGRQQRQKKLKLAVLTPDLVARVKNRIINRLVGLGSRPLVLSGRPYTYKQSKVVFWVEDNELRIKIISGRGKEEEIENPSSYMHYMKMAAQKLEIKYV
jgi:hypothetical protein